jgi:hypothetical protein
MPFTYAFDGDEYVTLRPEIEESPKVSEDVTFARFSIDITGIALATPRRALDSMDRAESRILFLGVRLEDGLRDGHV